MELVAAEVQARTAEQLFTVLGELKGGVTKVGQWMSAMEAAMPEPKASPYAEALTRLQATAPAMPATMVHHALVDAFGKRWRARFTTFDNQPAAAASIGQVHHATWHDGREVAVKLQYPRAAEALASDLKRLNRLTPLLRAADPGMDACAARSRAAHLRTFVACVPLKMELLTLKMEVLRWPIWVGDEEILGTSESR